MYKKGVSLLILVITIIVVLILLAAVILGFIDSGILDNAIKSRFMNDYRHVEEAVSLYSSSRIDIANATTIKLPLSSKLTASDKQDINDNDPTLKTKIEELNPGKTLNDIDLYWIDLSEIGINNLRTEKQDKGYIIDVATRQIYDYVGDYFNKQRWHTLDGGVDEVKQDVGSSLEMWDGWMKLTLFYPANSTNRQWRLGNAGEIRVDPMLMWQDYTGPITIPLDRVKDVWIRYDINNTQVTVPPAGTLLVDIVPDVTGNTKVNKVNVTINYDAEATVKEYKVGNSDWMAYTGQFSVTENCLVQARAKKTESIYNADGSLLTSRDLAGSDMVYIGNIGPNEDSSLAAPTITRLPAANGNEVAGVQITYPANAVRKIYKINYGDEQSYTNNISVKNYGTYIIAYYYDANGNKSLSSSIYINDTSSGDSPDGPQSYEPLPPYSPGLPPPYDPDTAVNLPAPTITKLAPLSDSEKARIQVSYPSNADRKIYSINYGPEQNYSNEISVETWGTYIMAYYYDSSGNKSQIAYIRVNQTPTSPGTLGPSSIDPADIVQAPIINLNPSTGIVTAVTTSVKSPDNADRTYIKIGRYGQYQEYTGSIEIRSNTNIYAYYVTLDGRKSLVARAVISNIQAPGPSGTLSDAKPYINIAADPYPYTGSSSASQVAITIQYSAADKVEYSEDGIVYQPYTGSFVVTKNERVYARGTNKFGVTETYLDITNIGILSKPPAMQNLTVNINVNPEPSLSTIQVAKASVSIDFDSKATEKYYRINATGDLITYTGPFDVASNCTIYAYAKATNAIGKASKTIDNLIDGISDPIIVANPNNSTQASKDTISITFDKNATIKRYSVNGSALRDYLGQFDVTTNGAVIYAYSQNIKGQTSSATYTVQNIVPEPPVLVLDKKYYYLLKLSYPDGSSGREYKWKEDGTWTTYKEDGILLIKPQYKDQVIQNGTLIKIEDENGNLITFKGDYYLVDVPISELTENIFMRWDRLPAPSPQIVLNTLEPAKQVKATIIFDKSLIKQQYRVSQPDGTLSEWKDYTSPITIDRNNTIIYAQGMDEAEVWSAQGMYKVTNIDEVPPVISLTADLSTAMQKVAVKVNVTDDVAVGKVKWAPGAVGESYFVNGGTEILNDSVVNITSNGYYTFYAEDKVGNTQVYTLNVTNVDLTPPAIDISVNPETTTGTSDSVTINYGDSVKNQYKIGANNTTWSSYTAPFTISSYTVLANKWQNSDGTVTIYAQGVDSSGNSIVVQKKVVNLDIDMPVKPVIHSNSSYATITSYGVIFDASTTITYDSRTDINNYYSIDSGKTWVPYTGQFNMVSGTIIAKSVKKSSGLEVSVSQTIAMPSDAMKPQAYDNNFTTFSTEYTGAGVAYIDQSMQGKRLRIKMFKSSAGYNGYLNFIDSNGAIINKITLGYGQTYDSIYTIPSNAVKTSVICDGGYMQMYEIQPSNEPTFSATNGYMLLTADPTKYIDQPYQMVTINYFPTSVQRLYRIGTTGDWLSYNDQPVKVNHGLTIYAKGVDQYGNETRIVSSYTSNVTNAMYKEAFDGDYATFSIEYDGSGVMDIDSSMQGKRLRIKMFKSSAGYNGDLNFLDKNGVVITKITIGYGQWYDSIYTIPSNATRMYITCNGGYMQVYEIQPSNEPTFTAANGYMLITADPTQSIKQPYQMVTINYFQTSVQKLYQIGSTSGTWLPYNNQPVKVIHGQTIYAKGIDRYGNETRVVSSYTSNVTNAMYKEAFDGDYATFSTEYDGSGVMDIDSSMQGRRLRIKMFKSSAGYNGDLNFLDKNGAVITKITIGYGQWYDNIYTIPLNATRMYITCNGGYMQVYELQASNEPTFTPANGYMLITADPTQSIYQPYQMVTVNYFPTSVQRLYQVGSTTGTWLNYNNQPIKVNHGDTIYAKGIDIYGNETRIVSSYTSNVTNAMYKEAFDGNISTYSTQNTGTGIMDIDPTMQGKRLRIKMFKSSAGYNGYLNFLNSAGTVIANITLGYGQSYDGIYTIPTTATRMNITCDGGYMQVYELQNSNEPTFTAVNGYMLISADSTQNIKEPYQMVTLHYFPTSVQRLYQVGSTSGTWLNYNDQPIKVNHGQTIYAKGIDTYGNETRIVSSYTPNVSDAMFKEAFDGNYSTFSTQNTGTGIMNIDSSMQGKSVRIRMFKSSAGYNGYLNFINSSGTIITKITLGYGQWFDGNYTIPSTAVKMSITCDGGYMNFYDIQPN